MQSESSMHVRHMYIRNHRRDNPEATHWRDSVRHCLGSRRDGGRGVRHPCRRQTLIDEFAICIALLSKSIDGLGGLLGVMLRSISSPAFQIGSLDSTTYVLKTLVKELLDKESLGFPIKDDRSRLMQGTTSSGWLR